MKHRTTDPACRHHRTPRTWFGRLRYDRNRGRSCTPCMERRGYVNILTARGYGRGEADAILTIIDAAANAS